MATVTKDQSEAKTRSKPERNARAFVEQAATPLNDADRDVFLTLLDADDEPNEELSAAAAKFKAAKQ